MTSVKRDKTYAAPARQPRGSLLRGSPGYHFVVTSDSWGPSDSSLYPCRNDTNLHVVAVLDWIENTPPPSVASRLASIKLVTHLINIYQGPTKGMPKQLVVIDPLWSNGNHLDVYGAWTNIRTQTIPQVMAYVKQASLSLTGAWPAVPISVQYLALAVLLAVFIAIL